MLVEVEVRAADEALEVVGVLDGRAQGVGRVVLRPRLLAKLRVERHIGAREPERHVVQAVEIADPLRRVDQEGIVHIVGFERRTALAEREILRPGDRRGEEQGGESERRSDLEADAAVGTTVASR